MFLIATANIFSWILTIEQIPQMVKNAFMSITDSKYVLLLLINLLLLVVGMFLDSAPALTMLVPVLAPLASAYGINLVHFGVIMCVNLCIGLLTPPVGTCLFVGCRVSKMPLMELVRNIWIELFVLIGVCFVITYIPPLVTFLPSLGG
jgi:TRAP dicarboxylate transporter, dctM subunit